jgi:hypothetical protein
MALKPLNSVGGFSVGEVPANVIYPNTDFSGARANFTGNVFIANTTPTVGLFTDNLYYCNGSPWDMQQPAGANYQVQFFSGGDFGASANFTFDPATSNLVVVGTITGNTVNVSGNVNAGNFNGNFTGNIAGVFANGTSNVAIPTVNGNINLTANGATTLVVTYNGIAVNGIADISGNLLAANASLGNLATANFVNVASNTITNNLTVNLDLAGNTANFTGNISALNANLGNLATANYVNVASNTITNNLTVNNGISGNTANFSGNVVVPNLTVNLELQANTANFDGNVVMDNWLTVANTANVGNLRTDNLLYANGQPWDLQEAAGSNTQIQYNDGLNNFGASANFTYNDTTQVFTVNGNANITNTVITPNIKHTGVLSTQIVYANSNQFLVGSNNFVWDASNNELTVNGNIAGNTITATDGFFGNIDLTGDISVNSLTSNSFISANSGNVYAGSLLTDNLLYANGQPWDLQEAAGNVGEIQYNDGNDNFAASANFVFDSANSNLKLNGSILMGQTQQNQIVNLSNTALEIRGGWNSDSSTAVNIAVGDYANSINWGKLSILGNVSGNAVGFAEANAFVFTNPGYGSGNVVKVDILNPTATSTTTGVIQANGGIGVTGNGYFGGNLVITGDIANANNISATNALNAVTGNFSGNINSLNANLGNLATANYVNVAYEVNGNVANFSGNLTSLNANLGNLATANYVNVANDVNVTGNVNAGNLVGPLANGNTNIKLYQDANVEITVGGVANTATFSSTGFFAVGNIQTTAGNILANGNVTANGTLNGANANITGEVKAGSVLTANITAPSGNITISAAGANENIILVPTGTGVVDVSMSRVVNVMDPSAPHDAATKEYVDNLAVGLTVHTPVRVVSATNLNATYANGGSVLTTIAITGNKTIQFSAAHGLSIGDEISWDNSFNGIIGDDPYFVYTTPASDTITVKAGYFGAEVTTLTNGTSLSQTARANTGVGATLTNAGANAAISIDGISLSLTNRVLVIGQTNQAYNGVYTVTTVGAPDSPGPGAQWVLTRATTEDIYGPRETGELGYGDYFYVTNGNSYAGSSYVLTSPVGEILFGHTNIVFTQFAAATAYSAGNGINITGTTISANVDNETTAIVSGNITVKVGANLTTPNIGDATFSSLSWNNLSNGNVSANNLSASNIANIGTDLTVGNSIVANGNITSNAALNGNTLFVTNTANVQGNILGDYITANHTVFSTNANVSGNTITNTLTVNNALTGNTANFSGNVLMNNATVNLELAGNTANFTGAVRANSLTVNLELAGNTANFTGNVRVDGLTVNNNISGNTANFTGNISALNANLGNLVTANFFTGTLINGNSNVSIPTANGNVNITANGNATLVITETGANVTGYLGVTGNISAGNIVTDTVKANLNVEIGNTNIGWGNVTTSSITANQTIAEFSIASITGVEFLVKGVDSTGGKYSVATVTAVTDGLTADYAIYATATIGGSTGTLVVNKVGSNLALQVTPSSSNSISWIAQYRTI